MRYVQLIATGVALILPACGNYNGPYGGGGGAGGGGGGPVGSVTVGSGIQFVSGHNSTQNPAIDTVAVGGTVTWTWSGTLPHSVRSVGATTFTSSATMSAGNYGVTFNTPGTYQYDCAVHGAAMTGRIVVR